MLLTQEISQNRFHPIKEVPLRVRRLLLSKRCTNCGKLAKEEDKIDYVACYNSKVVWWHHKDIFKGEGCNLK